ncbi:FHA domain-containing protein [Microbacterium sp. SSM24]|uniref:FHA domain-containing protein n=1 Tax=Microbacterium sp. SSM24 TaxID=2991714 RepID=UPI002226EBD2|nr:FHA domain-containing protein [Microbacterium sp. SSM24]MCW3492803.1 FHA domain-containing protein [Microbacterium sp. SSM24]
MSARTLLLTVVVAVTRRVGSTARPTEAAASARVPFPPLVESARTTAWRPAHPSSALARHADSRMDVTRTLPPMLAVLTWDDGSRMAVYGRTLYGRNPAAESGTSSVPVRDETLSLSKTHFEIGGDATGAWIADRSSTNGTVLVRDGGRHPLVAGLPTMLRAGDRLELGDRTAVVGIRS